MPLLHRYSFLTTLFIVLLGLSACGTQVERVDVEETHDLSGAWNDTDSRLVSEEMINDMLARPWRQEYTSRYNKQPTVIVGTVRNLSHEHINVNTFVNDIERAMINSGKVTFVASSQERGEIRDERKDQDCTPARTHANPWGRNWARISC